MRIWIGFADHHFVLVFDGADDGNNVGREDNDGMNDGASDLDGKLDGATDIEGKLLMDGKLEGDIIGVDDGDVDHGVVNKWQTGAR